MSSATTLERSPGRTDSAPPGQVVASYPTYEQAQRAVDHLSDSSFPVEHSAIVGRDLRLFEQVEGRLTKTRAALMGAASGAWFGVFVGTVLTFFETGPEWLAVVLIAAVFGAIAGAIYGFVAHWATFGRRDFTSARNIVAARYDVTVTDGHSEQAATLLSSLG